MCMDNYSIQRIPEPLLICRNQAKLHRLQPFFERILRVRGTDIFQERIYQTLENKQLAWLDDIIVVTKSSKEQHKKELIGWWISNQKYNSNFFKMEIEWTGHKIDQNRNRPLQDKLLR